MHAYAHRTQIVYNTERGPTEPGGQDSVPSSAKVLEAFVAGSAFRWEWTSGLVTLLLYD